MHLDNLEFRTPLVDFPKRDGTVLGLLVSAVWQRRLKSLWAYVLGFQTVETLDFPNTAAQTSSDLTVLIPGAAVSDLVEVTAEPAAMVANSIYTAFVSAAGEVTVRFHNYSAGAINPPSAIFTIQARQP